MDNPFNSPEFREEFNSTLDEKLEPVLTLVKGNDRMLQEHERVLQKANGVRWAIGIVGSLLLAAFEFVMHGGPHK